MKLTVLLWMDFAHNGRQRVGFLRCCCCHCFWCCRCCHCSGAAAVATAAAAAAAATAVLCCAVAVGQVGMMGLVEMEWIATLPCVDAEDVIYNDFVTVNHHSLLP